MNVDATVSVAPMQAAYASGLDAEAFHSLPTTRTCTLAVTALTGPHEAAASRSTPGRGPGCSPDGRWTAARPTPIDHARGAPCSRSRRCPRDRSAASRRQGEILGRPMPGTRGAAPTDRSTRRRRRADPAIDCHDAPLRSPPACTLLFTSVYANDSLCPSFQPARANTRTSLGNVYSVLRRRLSSLGPADDRRRRRASDRDRRGSPRIASS